MKENTTTSLAERLEENRLKTRARVVKARAIVAAWLKSHSENPSSAKKDKERR
jgi:hypothetical protein